MVKHIPTVVDAIAESEALPEDLRTLLKLTLPVVLSANKADRGPWEGEVVDQAQKALGLVQASLEEKHKEALAKQNTVISPKEHADRTSKKKEAEAGLDAAKAAEAKAKEAKSAGEKAVHDSKHGLKAAEKELAAAEKDIQTHADQKATLTDLLSNEFALLRDGTSAGAGGKKAVNKLLAIGKEYSLDSTCLQTFPMTCKKPAANRSEFESMMFTTLQGGIDKNIGLLNQKLAEAEPVKAQKVTALANAKDALEKAEAGLVASIEALNLSHTAHKDAVKEVSKADSFLYKIWDDMREVCDAQDELGGELKNHTGNIMSLFGQLKAKEPEPEPVEPMEEEAAPEVPAVAPVAAPEAVAAAEAAPVAA